MTDLIPLSHAINSETTSRAAQSGGKGGGKGSDPVPVNLTTPKAPKQPTAAQQKAIDKDERKETEDMIRARLRGTIRAYLESRTMGPLLQEHKILLPSERSSVYECEETLASIKRVIKRRYKDGLVKALFHGVAESAEMALVWGLRLDHFKGLAYHLEHDTISEFEQELEEIAIEMGDDWVPDAKIRLLFKLAQVTLEYSKRGGSHPKRESEEDEDSEEEGKESGDE